MSNGTFAVETGRLYGIEDAAELCGSISPWTLRKHISRGSVQVTRIGRRVFLRSEEIERIRQEGLPSLGTPRTEMLLQAQEISLNQWEGQK